MRGSMLWLLPVCALLNACGPKAVSPVVSMGRVGGAPPSLVINSKLLLADGNSLGEAQLLQMAAGVQLIVRVQGLPEGQYATHLHAIGRCTPPDFVSAGPHFNPGGRQHGRDNPMGAHAGDLPNISIDAKGAGEVNIMLDGLRLADGTSPLLDADGTALMLHAKADDYRSDPAGNAGARIACGQLQKAANTPGEKQSGDGATDGS